MKIVLIGAGNLATHLGKALKEAGHDICQVYSRTLASAVLGIVLGSAGSSSSGVSVGVGGSGSSTTTITMPPSST